MAGKKKLESVFWGCIKDRCEWFLHLSVGGSAGVFEIDFEIVACDKAQNVLNRAQKVIPFGDHSKTGR